MRVGAHVLVQVDLLVATPKASGTRGLGTSVLLADAPATTDPGGAPTELCSAARITMPRHLLASG